MSEIVFVTIEDISKTTGSGVATREIIRGVGVVAPEPLVVLCPRPTEELPMRVQEHVDEFRFLPSATTPGSPRWHAKVELSILRHLVGVIRERDISIVVTRMSPSTLFPAPVSHIAGVSHVLLLRGWARRTDDYGETKFGRLVEQLVRMNVRLSDRVFVAFNELKQWVDQYRDSSQSPVEVLPNGVDPELFEPVPTTEVRADLGIDPESFVVGFVGALAPRHELSTLIQALASVDETEALIVGDGDILNELERLAGELGVDDRVTFTGRVDHEQVPQYISAFDVGYGVSSPNKPSNPIKCYEYLACERPVITSDEPEFAFVRELEAGITVETLAQETVASAIRGFERRSPEQRLAAGRRGRDYIIAHETWRSRAERILASVD